MKKITFGKSAHKDNQRNKSTKTNKRKRQNRLHAEKVRRDQIVRDFKGLQA